MVNIFRRRLHRFKFLVRTMLGRGRFCKKVLLLFCVFAASFYGTLLFFGDLRVPRVMSLTNLDRCPACYGVTLCPEMYSNQIIFEEYRWDTYFFNAKNVYYGYTKSKRKVILKKLAHNRELNEFDSKLCKRWKLKRNCKPIDLLNVTNVNKKIEELVHFNSSGQLMHHDSVKSHPGLTFCPYAFGIHDFILPVLIGSKKPNTNYKSDLINVWTMLSLNPEPIILQVIPKSKGWRVPAFAGVCGRLEVVAYEGETLDSLSGIAWHRKLTIAKHILNAAMDFTFKHDRFRFYLMDWSTDNIVVNEKDEVTFVDLEDVVVIDKYISPKSDLPDWYQRDARADLSEPNAFSIHDICTHHLSDHNIFNACHLLGGDKPFLSPVPQHFKQWPYLVMLLQNCLKGLDRFKAGTKLTQYIGELLLNKDIIGAS